MVLTLTQGFLLVILFTGVLLSGIGIHTYRTWDQPGTTPFVAFLVVCGVGIVGIAGFSLAASTLDLTDHPWSPLGISVWALSMIPWLAFALQYTGTYTRINRRTVTLIALPAVAFPLLFAGIFVGDETVYQIVGSLSALYLLGLMTVGCYLVLRTSHQYGHLSVRQGLALSVVPTVFFLVTNFSGALVDSIGEAPTLGFYASGLIVMTAATAVSLYRYDTFESTPAVGRIGERTIVRQTGDLMFVVDEDGRVIRLNRTAANRLGVAKTEVLGDQLSELIGVGIDDISESETIELLTDEGSRQFDPVLSELRDQHGRELGHTLSLHDVTELELREQRLEVLNRVLRHNLRNQVEVIKSNAEFLSETTADGYADSIIESADRLSELGRSARAIDQVVSQPGATSEVDLTAIVRETIENARERNGIELSVSAPAEAVLLTDRNAFLAAAESAIEKATVRASGTVTVTLEEIPEGYLLTVVDDGPGIPEEELASVSAGTETPLQHATGLGLWQLKWAVTTFNGDLSIENDEGTAVEIRVPDQCR